MRGAGDRRAGCVARHAREAVSGSVLVRTGGAAERADQHRHIVGGPQRSQRMQNGRMDRRVAAFQQFEHGRPGRPVAAVGQSVDKADLHVRREFRQHGSELLRRLSPFRLFAHLLQTERRMSLSLSVSRSRTSWTVFAESSSSARACAAARKTHVTKAIQTIRTPTGFRPTAQGWPRPRPALGLESEVANSTPSGLRRAPLGATPLGLMRPVVDVSQGSRVPRQPWAGGRNPFGVMADAESALGSSPSTALSRR